MSPPPTQIPSFLGRVPVSCTISAPTLIGDSVHIRHRFSIVFRRRPTTVTLKYDP